MSTHSDEVLNKLLQSSGLGEVKVEGVGQGANGGVRSVTLTMKRAIDEKLLERAMQASDEATTVLLWTLEIEHQLSLFLEDVLGSPVTESNNLSTLVLMLSCRFDNDIFKIVNGFRKLRNKFAHEKDASLAKHKAIVESIFACKPPSPTEDEVTLVHDGERSRKLEDFPAIGRLAIYANLTVLFLATASQIYSFPKPTKRIVVRTTKSPQA